MGITNIGMSSNSTEYLHNVLAHIQNLCAKAAEEGATGKHQQIRVVHWLRKLRSQPTSNPTWLKSVLEYANVLLHMLLEGVIEEPFTKMPPHGPLAALPRYQVARLTKTAKRPVRETAARPQPIQYSSCHPDLNSTIRSNNSDEPVRAVVVVEKVNKQIQTQEQDDQWEWQRVWKGAFDKIRQQLQMKTKQTEALAIENKELLALVAGYKKALDEAERNQRELEAKHLAEIENLRAVHSLELSDLQSKQRQKLQEVALQNDEKLFSRRRESQVVRRSQDANADANSDFLQYIDDFYSATLHLTAQNKV